MGREARWWEAVLACHASCMSGWVENGYRWFSSVHVPSACHSFFCIFFLALFIPSLLPQFFCFVCCVTADSMLLYSLEPSLCVACENSGVWWAEHSWAENIILHCTPPIVVWWWAVAGPPLPLPFTHHPQTGTGFKLIGDSVTGSALGSLCSPAALLLPTSSTTNSTFLTCLPFSPHFLLSPSGSGCD